MVDRGLPLGKTEAGEELLEYYKRLIEIEEKELEEVEEELADASGDDAEEIKETIQQKQRYMKELTAKIESVITVPNVVGNVKDNSPREKRP